MKTQDSIEVLRSYASAYEGNQSVRPGAPIDSGVVTFTFPTASAAAEFAEFSAVDMGLPTQVSGRSVQVTL